MVESHVEANDLFASDGSLLIKFEPLQKTDVYWVFWWVRAEKGGPPGEKPEPVRTHLRSMITVLEMIGSIIGVYNDKTFSQVEIKPAMISHYQFHTSLLSREDLVLVQHTKVKWETLSGGCRFFSTLLSVKAVAKYSFPTLSHTYFQLLFGKLLLVISED
ncbi:hypothetical protein NC651_029988 [Populus alba x Populus x berolinensis]|nr:hypothetical protein NC651_029988 [Populus alba x Populus x berolinensis]